MAFTVSRVGLQSHLCGSATQEAPKRCRSSQTPLRLSVPSINHGRACYSRVNLPSVSFPASKSSRSIRQARRYAAVAAKQDGATSTVVAQEVSFEWKGSAEEVFLTGSFLNWDAKVALEKLSDKLFATKQRLGPGVYTFKYIVDGNWVHSPHAPTIDDGNGGYNNELVITAEAPPPPPPKEAAPKPVVKAAASAPAPAPKAAAPAAAAPKAMPAAKPAPKAKKASAKPLKETMLEDVIPVLRANLEAEAGVTDIILEFEDNQLTGTLTKDGVPISFWAYFPDGKIDGARGFSLTAHGYEPSTVEPFLIDEKRITPDLVVFWVTKRLVAQKMLSLN